MNYEPVSYHVGMTLDVLERAAIEFCLKYFKGNKTSTAKSLDISVKTLDAKLARYKTDDIDHGERLARSKLQRQEFALRARGIQTTKPVTNAPDKAATAPQNESLVADDAPVPISTTVAMPEKLKVVEEPEHAEAPEPQHSHHGRRNAKAR